MMKIAISEFVIIETANIVALYFFPGNRIANGVGVFKAWEQSKSDPEIHNLVSHPVKWVAGTILIFILLWVVILFSGDARTLRLAGVALALSIASFF